MQTFIKFAVEIISLFALLFVFRMAAMVLTKKVNPGVACFDSIIYCALFTVPKLISINKNPPLEALLLLVFFFFVPALHIHFKKRFFAKNGVYTGAYYPMVEFFVLFLPMLSLGLFIRMAH